MKTKLKWHERKVKWEAQPTFMGLLVQGLEAQQVRLKPGSCLSVVRYAFQES
jgi:hypothetical protein